MLKNVGQRVLSTNAIRRFGASPFAKAAPSKSTAVVPPTETESETPVDYNDKTAVMEKAIPGFRAPFTIPTNYEIATGQERYELLKMLKGENPFEDMTPIKLTHKGTKENPIKVKGVDPVFYVGCSGFPADSHETVFLTLNGKHPYDRCPECGSVFKYTQYQEEHHDEAAH